jgi:hypothetical protein
MKKWEAKKSYIIGMDKLNEKSSRENLSVNNIKIKGEIFYGENDNL